MIEPAPDQVTEIVVCELDKAEHKSLVDSPGASKKSAAFDTLLIAHLRVDSTERFLVASRTLADTIACNSWPLMKPESKQSP